MHQWWQDELTKAATIIFHRRGKVCMVECSVFTKHNTFHSSKKGLFWSPPSKEHSSGLSTWSFTNGTQAATFFVGNSIFLLTTLPHTSLLYSVLLMMVSWTITFTNARVVFRSLDINLVFFETPRILYTLLLLVGSPLLGKVIKMLNYLFLHMISLIQEYGVQTHRRVL